MYVHRNGEQNQPYSCVMITPSAPPVNEDFFYPGSPSSSSNKKADSDSEDDGHSSSSSHTVRYISYHSELLAPISSSNNNNTESSSFNSIDHFDNNNNNSRTYHRHSIFTNHRRNEQYELTSLSPPPYQVSDTEVPLLAAQEDDVNIEQITEATQSCTAHHDQRQEQSPANILINSSNPYDDQEYNKSAKSLYSSTRRYAFFSPRLFIFAFFFMVIGLSLVIASIIMIRQCMYECETKNDNRKSQEAIEDGIVKFCGRRCHTDTAEVIQYAGGCVAWLGGLVSMAQFCLLSMWHIHLCCIACSRK